MRSLIYITVSRTPVYREMLCLLVKSLRGAGRYTGEIQVMCNLIDDSLSPIKDLATLRICEMNCGVKDERMEGLSFIDPTAYDVVLNLDCDIVALNPIAPLFDCVSEMRWFDEPWGYLGNIEQMYTYYFPEDERRRYAWCHTVNAGHFCVSADHVRPLYDAWKRTLLSKPHVEVPGSDQAALNALIRRGLIPGRPFDRGVICNATQTPEAAWRDSAIVHFAGYGPRLERMRELAA